MDLKQRLDTFADAIIAIILTITVLALPSIEATDRASLVLLARSLGVYAISFCFVGNIWYQHAVAFGQIDHVNRGIVLWDLLLMFALSLVPEATKMMATLEDPLAVMFYGVLYLVVTLILAGVVRLIAKERYHGMREAGQLFRAVYGMHLTESTTLVLANLVLAYFFPRVAMAVFIVLTVRSFFANVGDQKELGEVSQLGMHSRDRFLHMSGRDRRQFAGALRGYVALADNDQLSATDREAARQAMAADIQRQFGISMDEIDVWLRSHPGHKPGFPGRNQRP